MKKLKDLETGSLLIADSNQVYFESYEQQSVKTLSLVPLEGEASQQSKTALAAARKKEKEESDNERVQIERVRAERQFR